MLRSVLASPQLAAAASPTRASVRVSAVRSRLMNAALPAPRVAAWEPLTRSAVSAELAPLLLRPQGVRPFSASCAVGTDAQAPFVGVGSGHAPPGSPVTVFVSLPGALRPLKIKVFQDIDDMDFLEQLRSGFQTRDSLAELNIAKLELRVLWKAERGAPSAELALAAPAVVPEMPLLQQVHEVGADGSVSATPVAWSSLAQRGGYLYVHVRDTSVPGMCVFNCLVGAGYCTKRLLSCGMLISRNIEGTLTLRD